MQYGAVRGSLKMIKSYFGDRDKILIDVDPERYEIVTQKAPWLAPQRHVARSGLESLCHATVELLGLPRVEIPAEYVAAVIAVFVDPVNYMVACSWFEGQLPSANDMVTKDDPPAGMEHLKAHQLFGMVLIIAGNTNSFEFRDPFEKKMDMKIRQDKEGRNGA